MGVSIVMGISQQLDGLFHGTFEIFKRMIWGYPHDSGNLHNYIIYYIYICVYLGYTLHNQFLSWINHFRTHRGYDLKFLVMVASFPSSLCCSPPIQSLRCSALLPPLRMRSTKHLALPPMTGHDMTVKLVDSTGWRTSNPSGEFAVAKSVSG